jgi:hypothetical protein
MRKEVPAEDAEKRLEEIGEEIQEGTDETSKHDWHGESVLLEITYRNGKVYRRLMSRWMAEWEIADIPRNQPDVERARIIYDASIAFVGLPDGLNA